MRRARGYTLVELMIGSLLGLLTLAVAGQLFLQGSRSYREDERAARLHDELRFALAQLSQDLEMAGWWGGVRGIEALRIDASAMHAGADCAGDPALALLTRGDASPAEAHAAFACIAAADFHAGPRSEGSDIVAIQRVAGSATPPASLIDGHLYLKTDGAQATLYRQGPGANPAPHAGGVYFEYRPAIWYLRRYSVSVDESPRIPALCRKVLAEGGARMQSDPGGCVAQGIEDLQLEFGLDADGDGRAEHWARFATTPPPERLAQVVAVRVQLLARTLEADPQHVDRYEWRLGARRHAAFGDGYARAAMSALAVLRNPARRMSAPQLP